MGKSNRHSARDSATGRYAKMGTSAGDDFVDASAEDVRSGMTVAGGTDEVPGSDASWAPYTGADGIDGPTGHRTVVLISGETGRHLGTVTEDSLRQVIGRRNGNTPLPSGEHDGIQYLTRGQ